MLARPGELPTILDVVENVLGDRPSPEAISKLSIAELDNLSELVAQFGEAQSEQEAVGQPALVGGWLGALWSEPLLAEELAKSLLYYPTLLVLDPIADLFGDRSALPVPRPIRVRRRDGVYNTVTSGPRLWSAANSYEQLRATPGAANLRLSGIISNLYSLEPLIRSGVVVLRDQWPTLRRRSQSLATSVRHDIRSTAMQELMRVRGESAEEQFAVWDNLRGMQLSFDEPVAASDRPWESEHEFFYLAKTLAIADAAGAQYVPATERDLLLLRTKMASTVGAGHPSQFLAEVARVVTPDFQTSIERAVQMRQSSEGFADWRSSLDRMKRDGIADDPTTLRERVQDELQPRMRAVERELKSMSTLSSLDSTGADFVVAGGFAAATASFNGGDIWSAVGGAAASGAASWLRRAYGRSHSHNSDPVLATLLRSSKKRS